MNAPISLIVTSCGRFDLLFETLDSFLKFNTYKFISQLIIIDDSGLPDAESIIMKMISPLYEETSVTLICNKINIGQVKSIDLAYSHVINPYIFHLEDDWQFYRGGFLEDSIQILNEYPFIFTVWLRAHNDTNGHPLEDVDQLPFKLLSLNYGNRWHGFTWNPGLRRTSDYLLIKSFTERAPSEALASIWYMQRGYRSAITNVVDGYVRHIGWERSTALIPGTNKAATSV